MVTYSSTSLQLASFGARLRYDDIPPAVIDKAKAVLTHGLFIGLASYQDSDVVLARDLVLAEEPGSTARLLGTDASASRSGAAFYDSVLLHARGQDDSYRMLTHPGSVIIPALLAEGEGRGLSGRDVLEALVASYEIYARLARDIVPAVQNHGFRASALFAIFGATAAAARVHKADIAQFANALALAVSLAAGNIETSRAGTREMTFQEAVICQSGLQAARLAMRGVNGAPLAFEGAAGFFNVFTGIQDGKLSGSFHGGVDWSPEVVTADLGSRWDMLNVTMKIYSTAGFNQPVIEAVGKLAREHQLTAENVRAMRIEMNLWETVYPSPRFPKAATGSTDFGSTAYFAAKAVAERGYPSAGRRLSYGGADPGDEPDDVMALARRTTVVAGDRQQYAPRVTIETTDGRTFSAEMTGDEFKWDFATERQRIRAVFGALPFGEDQADALIGAIESLEDLPGLDDLVDLTLPG